MKTFFKIIVLTLILCFVFLMDSCESKNSLLSRSHKKNLEIDTLVFDNNYNNSHLSEGNLAINDDTLYFNYNGEDSILEYGTYKIDKFNSKRIYWHGPSFSPGNDLCSLQIFKNNILLKDYTEENMVTISEDESPFDGKIYRFNKENDSIELYSKLDGSKKTKYKNYEVANNKIYVFSKNNLYESDDGKKLSKVFDNLSDVASTLDTICCYISDKSICYISKDGYIKEYDFKKQKYIFSKKLSKCGINFDKDKSYLYIIAKCNNKIILICSLDSDYNTVVYDVTDGCKKIFNEDISDDGTIYTNIYKNRLFLSSEKYGLVSINVNTGKTHKLSNKGVNDIYVFDDKWIYYVNSVGGLNRITKDGKTIEKVFG